MTAPAPSVCPTCDGDGYVEMWGDWTSPHNVIVTRPCPDCVCICGGPLGHWCELLDDIAEDRMRVRRADR